MKNLKRLCVAIALTLTIALSAFAGEIPSPPCPPPDPGEIPSPPCSVTQSVSDDATTQTQATATVTSDDLSVTTVTVELLQTVLSLF
ncbi:MAG: hypothetical protein DMF69_22820 [Acidobacteria bacterium]|nr:MAG: hypothetical protein DMF69_22820 [Acidobacteriota bacterium]